MHHPCSNQTVAGLKLIPWYVPFFKPPSSNQTVAGLKLAHLDHRIRVKLCSNQTVAGLKLFCCDLVYIRSGSSNQTVAGLKQRSALVDQGTLICSNQTVAGLKPSKPCALMGAKNLFKSDRCGIETTIPPEPISFSRHVQIRPLRD